MDDDKEQVLQTAKQEWTGRGNASRNAFEALCELATTEHWCAQQYCGTCGHTHWRVGLKKLSQGMHPDLSDWYVRKGNLTVEREQSKLAPLFEKFNEQEQKMLTTIINNANVDEIATFCDVSAYLTLASWYTDGINNIEHYFKYEEPTLWGMTAEEWEQLD